MEQKGRTRTPLTAEEANTIRTARAAGVSVPELARQYRVHRSTIYHKLDGQRGRES